MLNTLNLPSHSPSLRELRKAAEDPGTAGVLPGKTYYIASHPSVMMENIPNDKNKTTTTVWA